MQGLCSSVIAPLSGCHKSDSDVGALTILPVQNFASNEIDSTKAYFFAPQSTRTRYISEYRFPRRLNKPSESGKSHVRQSSMSVTEGDTTLAGAATYVLHHPT